jgi:Carboxypeptidase regulatory-like domain/TonB dependent receptor/TonB-dependent Receptor Plug Domain
MINSATRLLLAVAIVLVSNSAGFAQGSNQSLSGLVVDAGGGVIPGATVVAKNTATGQTFEVTSNDAGVFAIPGIAVGTYSVTVTLAGFKTAILNDVRIVTATPASVKAVLEIGALNETIQVSSRAELVQSQTPTVSSTLVAQQLNEVPLSSRNALYAVNMLPGVQFGSGAGPRAAGINGLPNNTVNITVDGVQTGNMLQSTDGFFSMVTPRLDAVEEITITGAVPGSDSGPGSVQIQFATRSGTNRLDGSAYHYWRQPEFNSNYYFNKVNNLPKNEVVAHQYGFRQGGPIVLPGLFDGRNKAFFFFNYERLYQPSSATRTRTMLRPDAEAGIFGYNVTVSGVQQRRTVDLVALARANGQITAFDPTVMRMLGKIRDGANTTGTINDTGAGSTLQYVYQAESQGNQYAPTGRVDFNLSDNHRLSGSYMWQRFTSTTDLLNNAERRFPGLLNYGTQNSYRTTGSVGLRSTLSANLVNEVRGGWQWSPNDFFSNITASHFEDQDGYALGFPISTGPTYNTGPAPRNTTTWSIDNTLNWLRGNHSFSMGGGYAGIFNRTNGWNVVPSITLGFNTNTDPAAGMFSTTNFPSANADQLTEARNLYALLTGRVSAIPGTARLDSATGEYVYNGDLARKSRQSSFSAFLSDSWRATPALTISAGVRWDLHMPFTPADQTWSLATIEDICGISGLGEGPGGRPCNIFNPNARSGQLIPDYDRFEPGRAAHKTNWLDFAPNVGVAWRPNVQEGWLKGLLGDPEQATIRAGYALSYNQERIDRFTGNAGSNPGGTVNVARDLGTGYPLVLPGESYPVLFSQRSRLGPPAFPAAPQYPIAATTANSVNIFPQDRHLKTPRVHSYSAGIQRSIGGNMAFEVRYVGNQNLNTWAEEDWNERSVFNSGFLDEFKLAQRNITANIAAGMGSRGFAYTGAPGTSPLPIHLAYLNGSAAASNPAAYTSNNFTNQAFVNRFSALRPQVTGAQAAIDTATFRANALSAGLPRNLFVMNPMVSGTFVVQDENWTKYNSLQVELRRRLSQGLLVGANYTYGIKKVSSLQTLAYPRVEIDASDDRNAPHAFKMNWDYEIPVGRGRRIGGSMHPVLDMILGNWQYSGAGLVKTDRYRMVGVKPEGMSIEDVQKQFKIRIEKNAAGSTVVFSFPEDIRLNTWAAFSVDPATSTGYSAARGVPTGRYLRPSSDANCIAIYRFDCNTPDINLNGPLFSRWDMRLKKRFPIKGSVNFELMAEVLNVFDNINFNHSVAFNPANGEDTFRVTSAYTDVNTTFDPGGRIGQLVWRLNW